MKTPFRIFKTNLRALIRRQRTRTVTVRAALSGQFCDKTLVWPDRQTTDSFFSKIRTESGQQTDTGQDFPENPDKNVKRTVLSADVWFKQ